MFTRQNGQLGLCVKWFASSSRENVRPQQGTDTGSTSSSNDNGHVNSDSRRDEADIVVGGRVCGSREWWIGPGGTFVGRFCDPHNHMVYPCSSELWLTAEKNQNPDALHHKCVLLSYINQNVFELQAFPAQAALGQSARCHRWRMQASRANS